VAGDSALNELQHAALSGTVPERIGGELSRCRMCNTILIRRVGLLPPFGLWRRCNVLVPL